ncbi:Meprin A subunit beta [Ophiophagus hannah]|uniref:Meprin A subunit beta n=1 Tax=Ophiophagus hannah TaxID=8665 RepID=V8NRU2_OPHHA|nr:Meprin A subunit beta [Ophiophagus hannah]
MMFASGFHLLLLLLLTITCLTTQAANPDCTHVADFDNCAGDTVDFCPKGIACSCKDKVPYCRCPSYRNKWEDYWYMGPQCNYLWSTLDLILVIVVPAVTLSTIVFTLMQWVAYCRSQPKKSRSQGKQSRLPAPVIPNKPQRQLDAQPKQMMAFPRPVVQNQEEIPFPERFSYSLQRPLQRVPPAQDARSIHWVNEFPSADYDQETSFEDLPMRQLPKPKTSFLLPDYGKNSSQPMNHLSTNPPTRYVHPQYTYN